MCRLVMQAGITRFTVSPLTSVWCRMRPVRADSTAGAMFAWRPEGSSRSAARWVRAVGSTDARPVCSKCSAKEGGGCQAQQLGLAGIRRMAACLNPLLDNMLRWAACLHLMQNPTNCCHPCHPVLPP